MNNNEIKNIAAFHLGQLLIDPKLNKIHTLTDTRSIQPKLMEVLTYLCIKNTKVISADELINQCWSNQFMGDNPIHKCIAQLRKALGDASKDSSFIATIPKRGYTVVAKVSGLDISKDTDIHVKLNSNPYIQNKSFKYQNKDVFFGRQKAFKEITKLINLMSLKQDNWLNITGKIGCGKSSFINIYVVPEILKLKIQTENEHYQSISTALFINKFNYELCDQKHDSAHTFLEFLVDRNIIEKKVDFTYYLHLLTNENKYQQFIRYVKPQCINNENNDEKIILVIEHLELLFLSMSSKVNVFFKIVCCLLRSNKVFVLTAVNDLFLNRLNSYTELKIINYDLQELRTREISEAITKPAKVANITFDYDTEEQQSLSELILQEQKKHSIKLSTLQNLLFDLYQNKTDNTLTYDIYNNLGEVCGYQLSEIEHDYNLLVNSDKSFFNSLLFRLIAINPCDNKEILLTTTELKLNNLPELNIVFKFIKMGALNYKIIEDKSKEVNDSYCIEISNKILLRKWDYLSCWIKTNFELLYFRQDIKLATERWIYNDRHPDFLLNSNTPLNQIDQLVENTDITLTQNENTFIASSTSKYTSNKKLKFFISVLLSTCLISLTVLAYSFVEKNNQVAKTRNSAENLISFILNDLKGKLEPLGQLELLSLVGEKTRDYFKQAGTKNLTGKSLVQWVESLHILGEVNINKNDFPQAKKYFSQSNLVLSTALAYEPLKVELLKLKMHSDYWLGYLQYRKQNFISAETYWQEYLLTANKLIEIEPIKAQWLLEKSYALSNLGSIAKKSFMSDLAMEYFEQSILIKTKLTHLQPNNLDIRADLADTLSWQSEIYKQNGKLIIALDLLKNARNYIVEISTLQPDNYKWIEYRARLEHSIAQLFYDLNDLKLSDLHTSNTQSLLNRLILNDDLNLSYKIKLLWSYLLKIKILKHEGNIEQALLLTSTATKLINKFKTKNKYSNSIMRAHIYVLIEQAFLFKQLDQNASATALIDEALDIYNNDLNEGSKSNYLHAFIIFNRHITSIDSNHFINDINERLYYDSARSLINTTENRTPSFKNISLYFTMINHNKKLNSDEALLSRLHSSQYRNPDIYSTIF